MVCLKYPFKFKNAITFVYLKRVVSILICVQTYHVQTDEVEQLPDIFNTMCFPMHKWFSEIIYVYISEPVT